MSSIDFFYLISNKNFATEQAKKQAQLVFPKSKVFEWNEDLFTEKSPPYMDFDGIMLSHYTLSVSSAVRFFQLLNDSIQQSNADWMMILEPDVWVTGVPTRFPKQAGGITRNLLNIEERSKIEGFFQRQITPYYSMAGGSIISVKAWKELVSHLSESDIKDFFTVWPESNCGDAFLSMILWKFGIHIEDWPELFESYMGTERRDRANVFHGIKTWYNYE